MKYKHYNIPDNEIANLQKTLDITENEAIETWLFDNGYMEDENATLLEEKAKKVPQKRVYPANRKPKTIVNSDEKKALSAYIFDCLAEKYGEVKTLKKEKLFSIDIGEKNFKIDIIQTRKK